MTFINVTVTYRFYSLGKSNLILKGKARSQSGSLKQKLSSANSLLIFWIGFHSLQQLLDDWMSGVDLENLLLVGVELLGWVVGLGVSLRLHDTFHVSGPSIRRGNQSRWGGSQTFRDNTLLDPVLESLILQPISQGLELLLEFFESFLGLLALVQLQSFLGNVLELLSFELGHGLDTVFIDGLGQVQDFVSLLQQSLDEWRTLDFLSGSTGNVENGFLLFLHSFQVLVESGEFGSIVGALETEKFGQSVSVGGIFHDSQLDVGGELLPKVIISLLIHLLQHVQNLSDQLLLDDLEEFVLLEVFTGDVQRKIIGINKTTNEGQVLREHVLEVISDEDTTDVQLDVLNGLAVVLESILRSLLWHEEDRLESDFSFSNKVDVAQWKIVVLGDALVELVVFFVSDIAGLSHPNWLQAVNLLPVPDGLLYSFLLFFGLVFSVGSFLCGFVDSDGLGFPQVDGEVDELRVFVDELLKSVRFQEIVSFLLEVKLDLRTSLQSWATWIFADGEAGRIRLPDVLLVVVVLGGNNNTIGNQEGGVESNTELSNQILKANRNEKKTLTCC